MTNNCCVGNCRNNKNLFQLQNINYCKNHFLLKFYKYIIIIQKYYKSYRCRKKLNSLFYNLPNDVQKHILFYMNQEIYHKKYIKCLRNIVNKKSNNLLLFYKIKNKLNVNLINNIYYLNNKYMQIMYLNDLKCLYVYGEELITNLHKYFIDYISDNLIQTNNYNNHFIDLTNISINNILTTIACIHNFRLKYNRKFNIVKSHLL